MKQIFSLILLSVLFVSCNNKTCTCKGYTVDKNPCICIKFKDKIGTDFDSALDSLKKQYEPLFQILANEGHYSGKGYYIKKEKINVDFADDDRAFFRLTFIDSVVIYYTNYSLATHDVLDEKGNLYLLINSLPD